MVTPTRPRSAAGRGDRTTRPTVDRDADGDTERGGDPTASPTVDRGTDGDTDRGGDRTSDRGVATIWAATAVAVPALLPPGRNSRPAAL